VTFSYDPSELGTDPVDTVRFLLADTKDTGHYLEDEEIQFAYDRWFPKYGTYEFVASALADTIAARYAPEASYSADGVSVSLGPVGDQFRVLAASLREQHKSLLVGGLPDVGGVSPYEERSPEIRNFSFGTGMHDDLAAGQQDYGDRGAIYFPAEEYPGA